MVKKVSFEGKEELKSREQSLRTKKYCGDWMSKIKLLRVVSSYLQIRFQTDDSHTYRGFRIELRLFPKQSLLLESERALCDNQRFQYFQSTCFLISSYPEVSWQTANRICKDIDSEMISIENLGEEERIFSLLRFNTYQATSNDLSRPTRAFWLRKSNSNLFHKKAELYEDDDWFNYDYEASLSSKNQFKSEKRNSESHTNIGVGVQMNYCLIVTIDTMQKKKLAYRRMNCNKQAGYICTKKALVH
ncbi:uncharacterized protein B4U79_18569 [Dinothrombium tinctorium]|uniref:C-type lectin domain-containing protein n=1 Tax=Dinothrombium tinctorium TaxID=1965070 RepID=A0A3S3NYH3_9ACAR|nr:uncharacterized protein B4U79_18595 [Dinothrombium tinctorium]RWS01415.1 uncharacterized protein B4U79_18569 [Dinothrombium tinctorium]